MEDHSILESPHGISQIHTLSTSALDFHISFHGCPIGKANHLGYKEDYGFEKP